MTLSVGSVKRPNKLRADVYFLLPDGEEEKAKLDDAGRKQSGFFPYT